MASPPYLARIPPPLGAVAGGRKGGAGYPFKTGVSKKKFYGKKFPKKAFPTYKIEFTYKMKGNIVKRDKGDWVIWYIDPTAKGGLRILPLTGEEYEDGSEVEFEIIDNQAFIKHKLSKETNNLYTEYWTNVQALVKSKGFKDEDGLSDCDRN